MMKRGRLILVIILLVVSGCEKDIEINIDSNFNSHLFIESILFPGENPKVFISTAIPFFAEDVTPQELFVRGAQVSISGPSGTETLSPDSTFDKFRCRWVPFYSGNNPSQYGGTYTLTVNHNGDTYTASTTIDKLAPTIENIEYIGEFFDIYGGHDGVIINFTDVPGQENFYRYQMNRMITANTHHVDVLEVIVNDCTGDGEKFWISDLGRTVFNDENADGQQFKLFIEVAFEYKKGDSTWISLQSMDSNSAKFYQQLDEQLLARVNPFVEPVFLESQIEGALGVFGSVVLSDSVLFIYPVDGD